MTLLIQAKQKTFQNKYWETNRRSCCFKKQAARINKNNGCADFSCAKAREKERSFMGSFLFWLYFFNSVLLINHEIDSAYWKEWELFKLPGGITGFLLIHFPLLIFVLYGLVLVSRQSLSGLIFSL
jgi:hypothetical protein